MKLLTLDLTGTVFRFRKFPFELYREVASRHSIDCDLESLKTGFSAAWASLNRRWPNFGNSGDDRRATEGQIESRQWWDRVVHRTMQEVLQSGYSREKVEPVARELYELYSGASPYEVFPDADRFIKAVGGREDLKLGALTNFDKRIHGVLRDLDLLGHLDFVVCSEEAGASKPSRAIFDHALSTCGGAVSASDACHVGDDVEKDYLGALGAGWGGAVLLRRRGAAGQQGGGGVVQQSDVCEDFDQVKEKLGL